MTKQTPINAPLLRKLQAFCCVPGALRLEKIGLLLQIAGEAGYRAKSPEALDLFLGAQASTVESILADVDGRELGVFHLSAKSGSVHHLAFAQSVSQVETLRGAAQEASQVTRQLAYALGNPALVFEDPALANASDEVLTGQGPDDLLVSLQSWFPNPNNSGRASSLKDYERAKALIKSGLELRVIVAAVEGDSKAQAPAGKKYDVIVLAAPVGQGSAAAV